MYKVKLNVTSGHAVGTTQDKPVLRPMAAAVPAPAAAIVPVGLGLSLNLSNSLKQLNDPVSDTPALPTTIPLNVRNTNLQPGAFAHLNNERVAAVVASEPEDEKAAAPATASPADKASDQKDTEMDDLDTMEDLASSMVIKSTAKTGISASLATSTDAEEASLPDGLSSAIKKVHASLPSHPKSTAKKQAKKLKSAANAAAAAAANVNASEESGAPFETVVSGKKKNKKNKAAAPADGSAAPVESKVDAGAQAAAGTGGANAVRAAKKKRDKKRLKKKAAVAAAAAAGAPTPSPAVAATAPSNPASSTAAPAPSNPVSSASAQPESPASPPQATGPAAVVHAASSESVDDAPESPYVKSNDAFNSYRSKKLAPGNLNKLAERLAHLPKVASAVKKGSQAGKSRPRLDDAFNHSESHAHDGSDESKHNGDSSSAAQPSASGTENDSPGSARVHGSRRHRGRGKKNHEVHIHPSHPPAVDPAAAQLLLEKQQAAAAASVAKSAEARARLRTMLSHASTRSGGSVLGAGAAVAAPAVPKAGRAVATGGTSLASLSGLSSHGTAAKTAPALAVRGLQPSEGQQAFQFPASSFQEFLKLNNEFVIREVLRHLRLDASADIVLSAVLDHTLAVDSNQ